MPSKIETKKGLSRELRTAPTRTGVGSARTAPAHPKTIEKAAIAIAQCFNPGLPSMLRPAYIVRGTRRTARQRRPEGTESVAVCRERTNSSAGGGGSRPRSDHRRLLRRPGSRPARREKRFAAPGGARGDGGA